MKYEKITDENIINKLYRPCKVQKIVMEFHDSPDKVWRLSFKSHEYGNTRTAQTSYSHAIKSLGYRMKARILDGKLYLIKLEDGEE